MAEGFGTLTDTPDKPLVSGRGVWKDNTWRVAFVYPLQADGKYGVSLAPGGETATAFAVWDGGNQEVGSRKAWSDWVTFTLAP